MRLKLFIPVILFLLSAFSAFAQVDYTKPYSRRYVLLCDNQIRHSVSIDTYYLIAKARVPLDDDFNIVLGVSKSVAVTSLNNIRQMMVDANEGDYITIQNASWMVVFFDNRKVALYRQPYNDSSNIIFLDTLEKIMEEFNGED